MRNFILALSLGLATSCAPVDGEIDPSFVATNTLPAILTVSFTPNTAEECRAHGQVAAIVVTATQGEARLTELDLGKGLKFGDNAKLEIIGDARHHDVWDNEGPFHPRHLAASGSRQEVSIYPNVPADLLLLVDPEDCPKIAWASVKDWSGLIEQIRYWDIATGKNVVQQVGS